MIEVTHTTRLIRAALGHLAESTHSYAADLRGPMAQSMAAAARALGARAPIDYGCADDLLLAVEQTGERLERRTLLSWRRLINSFRLLADEASLDLLVDHLAPRNLTHSMMMAARSSDDNAAVGLRALKHLERCWLAALPRVYEKTRLQLTALAADSPAQPLQLNAALQAKHEPPPSQSPDAGRAATDSLDRLRKVIDSCEETFRQRAETQRCEVRDLRKQLLQAHERAMPGGDDSLVVASDFAVAQLDMLSPERRLPLALHQAVIALFFPLLRFALQDPEAAREPGQALSFCLDQLKGLLRRPQASAREEAFVFARHLARNSDWTPELLEKTGRRMRRSLKHLKDHGREQQLAVQHDVAGLIIRRLRERPALPDHVANFVRKGFGPRLREARLQTGGESLAFRTALRDLEALLGFYREQGEDSQTRRRALSRMVRRMVELRPACADSAAIITEELHQRSVTDGRAGVRIGDWFMLHLTSGRSHRAKLSWISPFNHQHLFVSAAGQRLAEWPEAEVITALKRGDLVRASAPHDSRPTARFARRLLKDERDELLNAFVEESATPVDKDTGGR